MKKLLIVTLLTTAAIAKADSHSRNAVGAQIVKADDTMVGIWAAKLDIKNWGLYGDMSTNFGTPSGTEYNFHPNTFGDPIKGTENDLFSVHIGATKYIFDNTWGYIAGGMYSNTEYTKLYDPMHILDDNGQYYIPTKDDTDFSAAVGVITTLDRLTFKAGYQTGAGAIELGIGANF